VQTTGNPARLAASAEQRPRRPIRPLIPKGSQRSRWTAHRVREFRLVQANGFDIGGSQFEANRAYRAEKRNIEASGVQRHGFIDRNAAGATLHLAEIIQHDDRADAHGLQHRIR
jgi:hypothetical protein